MKERRETGTFLERQVDFIDYFLKKVDDEKNNPSTLYTGKCLPITYVVIVGHLRHIY